MNEATLRSLRISALRRADQPVDSVNSTDKDSGTFIQLDEANDYVNAGISELHDILVTSYKNYFQAIVTITMVAQKESYDLPSDFFKSLAVFYIQGGIRYRLEPFMLNELTDYEVDRIVPIASGEYLRYRLIGSQIWFTPRPNGAGTVEFWYIPQAAKLKLDSDKISIAVVNGWEEYIIIDAAIRMMQKEESDVGILMAQKQALKTRLQSAARTRDAGRPQRVHDVYMSRRNYPRRRRRY